MPFSESTEYPAGIFHFATLSSIVKTVGVASEAVKVSHILLRGGASERLVTFQETGDTDYFTVELATDERVVIPRGFLAKAGLEVLTDSATTDVEITVFYFTGE